MKKLIMMFLSAALLVGCGSGNSQSGKEEIVEKDPTPEYVEIVQEFGYDDISYSYPGLESASFAHIIDEYTLEVLTFGYSGDKVKTMTDSVFYNLEGLDQDSIDYLVETIDEGMEPFRKLDFCTVEFGEEDDSFYRLKVEYKDMDSNDHIKKVVDLGGLQLTEDSADIVQYLSLKDTADALVSGGWTRR